MAQRVREYEGMLLDRVARSGAPEREGGLPWVLPVVVYNGSEPWTAAGQATDLVSLPSRRMARDLALLPRLLEEADRFPGATNEAFRQALHTWARALWEHRTGEGSGFPTFDELERKEQAVMTTVAEAAWDRWEAKVRAEGVERGIARGGARLINRLAALKFGTATAERLAGLLEGLTNPEDLDKVGDWILECGSGGELLSRVSSLLTDKPG